MTNDTTQKIAALNDLCRTAMGIAGKLVQTSGISALPLKEQSAIREKVETFNTFSPDNDPHGERDFGAVEREDPRIFRKTRAICMIQQRGSLLQPLISSLMRHKASIGKANMFP
jgi:hypothetical protein